MYQGKGASGSFKLAAGAAAGEKKKAGGVKKTPKKAAKSRERQEDSQEVSQESGGQEGQASKEAQAEKKASLPKKPKKPAAKKAATPRRQPSSKTCNLEGHHAVACETPKCVRCEQFGHESCDAACVRCGGDHAVSSCPVRTYSSVASGSEPQPSASEPAATSVLGSPTVATENGDSQSPLSEGDSAGVDADSAAADALPSLSAAATSGGGSGEEAVAAPVVAPAAAAVPADGGRTLW
ncbi:uncharacterized protein LOC119432645 [Dermacentor silvarum]|uniref:uncharacterized protein LOC119432645 n=1 Tax=Dermacentor silvarum TaxID=543639 RepID=UPI002100F6D1|nr:uncharacterized protein LOC119432645 [Dermacentor silvarum]